MTPAARANEIALRRDEKADKLLAAFLAYAKESAIEDHSAALVFFYEQLSAVERHNIRLAAKVHVPSEETLAILYQRIRARLPEGELLRSIPTGGGEVVEDPPITNHDRLIFRDIENRAALATRDQCFWEQP